MIDPASKNQYIQLVTNAQLDVTGTSSLETIYTAPSGTDFDFAIIESILVGDDNGQATTADIVVTTGASNHYLFKQKILKIQVSHANINVFVSLVEYAKGD